MSEQLTILVSPDPEAAWTIWWNNPEATDLYSTRGRKVASFEATVDFCIVQNAALAIAGCWGIKYAGKKRVRA